ncbi:MAG: membrane protein insertion efficiency factor YidD [Sphaerospermopsis sp.]|nr:MULTISPECIES: membrane protein insertion efficiency factor YidD [Sphaerospermopsis]MDB9444654.1 membrane protein insertion efficiency factor YidD [Sphaerospermopsis kisseleviana CS-549]MEB3150609.1 membrane protein insertion efficiency factor YidD [Sphaerospermopsis sp.]
MFNKLIRKISVFGINFYQKHLSPYKGYCCAHRILHGGDSCSEYVKKAFLEQDLNTAIQLSRQRFTECGQAAENLASQKPRQQENLNVRLGSANLQRRSSRLFNRRSFLYLIIPAFFTFGLVTPALASKGKAYSQCLKMATKSSVRQDQKDGKCGNEPELYYGLCCLGIVGLGIANDDK